MSNTFKSSVMGGQAANQRAVGIQDVEPVPPPKVPPDILRQATLVMTVYNAPDVTRPALRSIHARTPVEAPLIVVDDASNLYTHQMLVEELEAMKGRSTTLLTHTKNQLYTQSINEGVIAAFADQGTRWAIALNSDVLATPGWLERMLRAVVRRKAGMASPYMSNAALLTLDMPPGASYLDTAERLAAVSSMRCPDAVTPVGACMLVSRDAWAACGPFDEVVSPEGYGEECDFWAKLKLPAIVPDDVFFYHRSHASFGAGAVKREKEAVERFMKRWGAVYQARAARARPLDPKDNLRRRLTEVRIINDRPKIAFYLKGLQICGGVLALVNICNRLIERGIDATIIYEIDNWKEARLMPTTFAPIRMTSSGIKDFRKLGGFERGLIFATAWATGDFVKRLCSQYRGLRPGAFIQDREDHFRLPNGKLQFSGSREYRAYIDIAQQLSVVNSNWVSDSIVTDFGFKPTRYIPIGVDVDLFYDRHARQKNSVPSILSFSRPATPRRGYKLLADLYKELHRIYGRNIKLSTYDQHPGPDVPARHFGKLPQDKLAEVFSEHDLLIEPSSSQGWGMPAQEMMATAGCAISTDNGGIHNYGRHDRNCLIAEAEFEPMIAAVRRAIDDPALRRRLGTQAREDIQHLSWDRIADAWARAIREWSSDLP